MLTIKKTLALSAALLLTACGGTSVNLDDSGSSNNSGGNTNNTPGLITAQNKSELANAATKISSLYEVPFYISGYVEEFVGTPVCSNNGGHNFTSQGNATDKVLSNNFNNCEVYDGSIYNDKFILNGKLEYSYKETSASTSEKLVLGNFSAKDDDSKSTVNGTASIIHTFSDDVLNEAWDFSWVETETAQGFSFSAKGKARFSIADSEGEYETTITIDGVTYTVKAKIVLLASELYLSDIKFTHPKHGQFSLDDDNEGHECDDYMFDKEDGVLKVIDTNGQSLSINFKGCGKGYTVQ